MKDPRVAQSTLAHEPQARIDRAGGEVRVALSGRWTAEHAAMVETLAADILADSGHSMLRLRAWSNALKRLMAIQRSRS